MSDPAPTPHEAQGALAEASNKAAQVRRADRYFGWLLLGVAAAYVGGAWIISVSPRPGGSSVAWIALFVFLIGWVVVFVMLGLRMRAYSRAGLRSFLVAYAVFWLWDSIVNGVSLAGGWWSPREPSYHIVVSEAVAVIPLLVAAWLIGRRS